MESNQFKTKIIAVLLLLLKKNANSALFSLPFVSLMMNAHFFIQDNSVFF